MGFSIGRLLGSIVQPALTILGGAFGGPAGALAGSAIGGAIAGDGRRQTFAQQLAARGPLPVAPSPLMLPVGLPAGSFSFGSQAGPTVQPAGTALIPFVGAARGLVAVLLGRASAFIGTRISSARVLTLVRDLGLAAAAAALGLTAVEVAQIIAAKPRRRRRGITAAQLATTKATIRRVHSINHAIASVSPPAARRRVHRHHPRHHRH
mgnify:CR=1 FL=1|jgi:hypothetical protein